MEKEIIDLLKQKSCTKQDVYRKTQAVFTDLQKLQNQKLNDYANKLAKRINV